MKRIAALLLTLVFLLAAVPAASADDYATATVKGGWLCLRDGASTSAKIISAYYTGTEVTLLGGSGEWFYVRTPDGRTGYMNAGYLTITGSITGGQVAAGQDATVVSGNGKPVNLRTGPGVSYHIIGTYPVGTAMTVLSQGDSWSQVHIDGVTGYMMNDFIKTGFSGMVDVVESYTAYVVSENGKGVVLRGGPGKTYDVLATYQVGQPVTMLAYGKSWCKISVNGLEGYMMTQFLSTEKPSGSVGTSVYTAYVTSQNGKGVRLRMGAGKAFPTMATYAVGTQATVLEYGATWCRISIGGKTGYMMTEFLTTRAPSRVSAVTLDKTAAAPGDTLHASVSPSDASVTVTWLNDKGATLGTGDAYYVRQSDAGRKIRASATGKGSSSGTVVSAWCSVSGYVSTGYQLKAVTLSDTTPQVGQTLKATLTPSGAAGSISWYRDNGVFIGSGATYQVRTADAGYKLRVIATGTGSTTGEATSDWTEAVAPAASAIALQRVTISDTTPNVGDTLKAKLTPANATAAFTWRSSKGNVLGNGETYTVTADDVGASIYVYANGTGTTTGSVVSSLTSKVQAQVETTVRVDGVTLSSLNPVVGQTLYVTLQPQTASATYTWYRDDDKILSTTGYYTVQAEDVGHSLYVWAEGANGTFGNATSKITAPVTEK